MAQHTYVIEISFNKARVLLTFYLSVFLLLAGIWAILLFTPYLLSHGEFWIPLVGVVSCFGGLYGMYLTKPKLSSKSVGITISDQGIAITYILTSKPRFFCWKDIVSVEKVYSAKTKNLLEVKYVNTKTEAQKSFTFTTLMFDCEYNELYELLNKKQKEYK